MKSLTKIIAGTIAALGIASCATSKQANAPYGGSDDPIHYAMEKLYVTNSSFVKPVCGYFAKSSGPINLVFSLADHAAENFA